MSRVPSLLALLAALTVCGISATAVASAAPSALPSKFRRLTLPSASPQLPFPYTIEVPEGWTARQVLNDPGLWIGPPDAKPNVDPRFIYVRISTVSLAEPEKIAAAIRQNDAKDDAWTAPLVEVREVHGVRGVVVQVDRGKDAEARSSLTLKLPLPKTSVDFVGQATKDEFAKQRALYERILFSAQPAPAPPAAVKPADKKPGG
ncbi:MAG TPA: hypothetical protein VGS22_09925 [Thermoanaerobaculia bacterium]|jgi:hypothetical protein|nr:hypothetical protein [Thermoanaerobaculia bacterium]